jgi:hypothetical protein
VVVIVIEASRALHTAPIVDVADELGLEKIGLGELIDLYPRVLTGKVRAVTGCSARRLSGWRPALAT